MGSYWEPGYLARHFSRVRERPGWAPQPTGPAPALYSRSVAVTVDEVSDFAPTLPGINEGLVRGYIKFRIKRIVWLSLSPDGSTMGFAFPKYLREALVHSDPEKFSLPSASDMRYHWAHVRLAAIDSDEMRELVEDAWAFCAPQRLADEYLGAGAVGQPRLPRLPA